MSFMVHSRTAQCLFALVLATATAGILAGCSNDSAPDPTPTTTTTAPPTTSPKPTVSTSPTAKPIVGIPISLDCNALISPQQIYDFNPQFLLVNSYTPQAGSLAAEIVKQKGLTCRWVNETSGDTIDVAVAQLPDDALTDLKNSALETSNPVPTYGDEAYFKMAGSAGSAEVFQGPFWVVATSQAFYEPGDATPIVTAALANLSK